MGHTYCTTTMAAFMLAWCNDSVIWRCFFLEETLDRNCHLRIQIVHQQTKTVLLWNAVALMPMQVQRSLLPRLANLFPRESVWLLLGSNITLTSPPWVLLLYTRAQAWLIYCPPCQELGLFKNIVTVTLLALYLLWQYIIVADLKCKFDNILDANIERFWLFPVIRRHHSTTRSIRGVAWFQTCVLLCQSPLL